MKLSFLKHKENLQRKNNHDELRYQIVSWGHWFALFNILFAVILASRYLFIMDWPNTLGGRVYAMVSLLGHFSFLVFISYLLFIFPLSFILRNPKTIRIIAISLATIALTVMLVDQQVYLSVNLHLNSLVWALLIEPSYNVTTHEWQRFFAFMPIIFLIQLLFANWSWLKLRSLQRQRWVIWLSTLFIFCFMATHFVFAWADANFYRPITMQKANYPLSYPMTARSFLSQYGFFDEKSYESRLVEEGDPTLHKVNYPLTPMALDEKASGYSIVLVVFDELTQETIDKLPGLNKFKEMNFSFNNHYSFKEPLFALEYGISPIYKEAILRDKLPSMFSQALEQRGYFQLHYDMGFGTEKGLTRFGHEPQNIKTLGALVDILNRDVSTILDKKVLHAKMTDLNQSKQTMPFFVTMLLSSQKTLYSPDKWQTLLAKINEFNNNTVVIITAKSTSDGKKNEHSPLKVPLMVKWPEVSLEIPVDKVTTHQDIVVTLLKRALRVTNLTDDFSQGEDLFINTQHNPFWVDGRVDNMIVQNPEGSVILNARSVKLFNNHTDEVSEIRVQDSASVKNEKIAEDSDFKKKQLGLVLQALFDLQRFWSD
ncbi:DUF3413 domain-containing protein [Thorsellia kenyensis]|uniref:DUF3413 domain-containing protein n=1 Tax=Thorsellia kenyensis TaxID=1549888 RepID=A0ABV6C9E8_9GAMM